MPFSPTSLPEKRWCHDCISVGSFRASFYNQQLLEVDSVTRSMEVEKLEKKGRRVLFDILKEWASASFHRQVRDTEPIGCAWQSLAMALQDAKGRNTSDTTVLTDTESDMRSLLIQAYGLLSKEAWRSVAEKKLQCPLSFFHQARYQDVELVLQHWNWYLYCLSFCSEATSHKPLELPFLKGSFVVRMPLDSVDCYFLAKLLRHRILLLQLTQPALRFGAQGKTLHLVTYGGMWAPLLSTKLWLQEKSDLSGSVVQIDHSLKGALAPLAGKSACILGYDVDRDCHIAASTHLFPLKSVQISRIITRSEDVVRHQSRHDQPPFCGIPDKSVEFQVLLHLLRTELGKRLEDLHEHYAGRPERPQFSEDLVPWEDFVSGHVEPAQDLESLCASSLPLQEVVAMLAEGKRIWTKCVVAVGPRPEKAEFLTCRVQDFICLEEVLQQDEFSEVMFLAHSGSDKQPKRLSSDAVCSWLVLQDFVPDRNHSRSLMRLHEGDTAIVLERRRGTWNGWAKGRVTASSQSYEHLEGDFKLVLLRPQIWIARIDAGNCTKSTWLVDVSGRDAGTPLFRFLGLWHRRGGHQDASPVTVAQGNHFEAITSSLDSLFEVSWKMAEWNQFTRARVGLLRRWSQQLLAGTL